MKKITFTILLAGLWLSVSAQQYPLFSHFNIHNFGFNPAALGMSEQAQLSMVYRKQWVGLDLAPVTTIAGIQTPLKKKGDAQSPNLAVGGYFFSDGAGALERVGATGALAMNLPVSQNTSLSAGFSLSYHDFRLTDKIPHNTSNIVDDPILMNAINGVYVPNVNTGVMLHNKEKRWKIGAAIPQIFKPERNTRQRVLFASMKESCDGILEIAIIVQHT